MWSIHIYLCKCGFQTSETAILQDSESRCLMPIYHVCVIFVSWAFLTFRNDTLFTISANTEFRIAETTHAITLTSVISVVFALPTAAQKTFPKCIPTAKLRSIPKQVAAYNKRSNSIPKVCLKFKSPKEVLEDHLSVMW